MRISYRNTNDFHKDAKRRHHYQSVVNDTINVSLCTTYAGFSGHGRRLLGRGWGCNLHREGERDGVHKKVYNAQELGWAQWGGGVQCRHVAVQHLSRFPRESGGGKAFLFFTRAQGEFSSTGAHFQPCVPQSQCPVSRPTTGISKI